ncbi:hypothetical protein EGI32_14275 [Ferruginibacter sp. HRS2-29]|nr:hypothetical protein [Ferruginibacter sp. HRS2-29]
MRRRNDKKEFVNDFSEKNGYPHWDKAIFKTIHTDIQSFAGNLTGDDDTLAYIPLVLADSNYVNGYLLANLSTGIALSYSLAQDYKAYPFELGTNVYSASAFAMNIMLLNQSVFGTNEFIITDQRLFSNDTVHRKTRRLVLGPSISDSTNASLNTPSVCSTVTVFGEYCGTPAYPQCSDWDGCDLCGYPTCYRTTDHYTSCTFEDGGGTGGGNTGGGEGGSPGNGPGGGGGSSPPHNYPCPVPGTCPPPGGGIGFIPDEPPVNKTPCEKILPFKEGTETLQLLWTQMNSSDPALKREVGFGFYSNQAPLYYQGPLISNTKIPEINFNLTTNCLGYIHTHPDFNDKMLPIFSPSDIIALYQALTLRVGNQPIADFTTFSIGVLNWKGDAYFMVIDDINKFYTFANRYDFYNQSENNTEFELDFKRANINHNTNAADTEKNFLQFLKSIDCGIKVLKSDQNFTQFTQLSLPKTTIISLTCF